MNNELFNNLFLLKNLNTKFTKVFLRQFVNSGQMIGYAIGR